MEPLTMFAATVGLIGAIHLLSTTVDRLGKGKHNRGNQQAKREDWYCFFRPSDLLGKDRGASGSLDKQQPSIIEVDRLEQRRRQQANRPRLQA